MKSTEGSQKIVVHLGFLVLAGLNFDLTILVKCQLIDLKGLKEVDRKCFIVVCFNVYDLRNLIELYLVQSNFNLVLLAYCANTQEITRGEKE